MHITTRKTAVTIDNNIIRSDSSFYYLGKTNNYVFFYDARNKSSIVYPREQVTKVVTTEKTPENCLPVFP